MMTDRTSNTSNIINPVIVAQDIPNNNSGFTVDQPTPISTEGGTVIIRPEDAAKFKPAPERFQSLAAKLAQVAQVETPQVMIDGTGEIIKPGNVGIGIINGVYYIFFSSQYENVGTNISIDKLPDNVAAGFMSHEIGHQTLHHLRLKPRLDSESQRQEHSADLLGKELLVGAKLDPNGIAVGLWEYGPHQKTNRGTHPSTLSRLEVLEEENCRGK